ncbi:MAG: UDP-glucose--hexose-1-phosphate uridylyltransferase [Ruminococcaceae bacterium]|nr:UDP-glucose--hexose-1-phosphate uridylyltransferase [Oscillospiraceae bacterium]
MVNFALHQLVRYGLERELIAPEDASYAMNRMLEALQLDGVEEAAAACELSDLEDILKILLDDAVARGVIEDSIVWRDILDTRLMGCLTPRPSEVQAKFRSLYAESPEKATDWYYKFSCDTDYIRRYRIKKDMKWVTDTKYGALDITINLSKPEKDPRAIAAAKLAPQSGYPKCALCRENEGYAGRANHAARQNHRILPLTIAGSDWFFQYSPYVYYNEHCIAFNGKHVPMKVERQTFEKMFDFLRTFPHYFIGSNADLPIVGGSILSHDHFQGGRYTFAMERAEVESAYTIPGYEDVKVGIVNWPMSVLRLNGKDDKRLVELADHILTAWRGYTDEAAVIYAETDGEPHNTITPIARIRDGAWELDLVLRNNLTTPEHPMGLYHPHAELHHIKKENIGLIEVMGLAVLPARLKGELASLEEAMVKGENLRADEKIAHHADWAEGFADEIKANPEKAGEIIRREVGLVFAQVLEDAGVYKRTAEGKAAFERFIRSL